MRVPSAGAEIASSGNFESNSFGVELSQHTFQVLSSGLYSNKIRAILREISCNAWDSHIEAGTTDTPFVVLLPSSLSPKFGIRDYGTGLSVSDLMDMYTKYFYSTKQNTNKMTGSFGLGSKSPFAYTKKYTVISYFQGKKHHFNAIINSSGFPEIVLVATVDTEEPNGLEVSFAVDNTYDHSTFKLEASIVLRPFPPESFVVRGYSEFRLSSYAAQEFCGPGWFMVDGSNLARMGNVEYPLDPPLPKLSPSARSVLDSQVVVDFPIGSFSVTPSREAIQWTDLSVSNVNDRLERIYEEFLSALEQQIQEVPTLWEAIKLGRRLRSLPPSMYRSLKPEWRGAPIPTDITFLDLEGVQVYEHFSAYSPRARGQRAAKKSKVNLVNPSASGLRFVLDDNKRTLARVRHEVVTNRSTLLVVSVSSSKALRRFLGRVGQDFSFLERSSSFPLPVKSSSSSSSVKAISRSKVFSFSPRPRTGRAKDHWEETRLDLNSVKGFYVEIRHWLPSHPSITHGETLLYSVLSKIKSLSVRLSLLQRLGVVSGDVRVIGVRTSGVAKFEKHPNWVNIFDFAPRAVVDAIFSDTLLVATIAIANSPYEADALASLFSVFTSVRDEIDKESPFYKAGLALEAIHDKFDMAEEISQLEFVYRDVFKWHKSSGRLSGADSVINSYSYLKSVLTKYPLLTEVENFSSSVALTYIQAMDYYEKRQGKK